MTKVKLDSLSFSYPDKKVIDNLSLALDGKINVIMGESGGGKSTMLDIIAGLKKADGKVEFFGKARRPKISYMMQDATLLPWMSALDNVNVVLSDSKATLDEAKAWLTLVGLGENGDASLFPHELSGGMKQRVALARTLAYEANIYLLDEPFRALNEELRVEMAQLVKRRADDLGATVILVTHDPCDAELLGADKVITFHGSPLKEYTLE